MMRPLFVVAIVSGVLLLAVPLADAEVGGSRAADRVLALTKPVVTAPSLRQSSLDLARGEAVGAALTEVGLPRLAALSGQSPASFAAELDARYPLISRDLARLPAIGVATDKVITNLTRRRGQFDEAKSLPGLGLTLNDGVWAELVIGALLLCVGIAGLARPRRGLTLTVVALGLVLLVGPLALNDPAKAADADALLGSLRPFSVAKVQARRGDLAAAKLVFTGFQQDVLPAVAAEAHVPLSTVESDLGAASPQLSTASLSQVDAILTHFRTGVVLSAQIQPLLVRADGLSAEARTWLLIGPGIALLLAGALSIAPMRARRSR